MAQIKQAGIGRKSTGSIDGITYYVLEPLRRLRGRPHCHQFRYRCHLLNAKVGGAFASQHTLGEAADIQLPLTSGSTVSDDNKRDGRDMSGLLPREWATKRKE